MRKFILIIFLLIIPFQLLSSDTIIIENIQPEYYYNKSSFYFIGTSPEYYYNKSNFYFIGTSPEYYYNADIIKKLNYNTLRTDQRIILELNQEYSITGYNIHDCLKKMNIELGTNYKSWHELLINLKE